VVNLATAFLLLVLGLFEGQLEKMVARQATGAGSSPVGRQRRDQTMTVAVRALATASWLQQRAFALIMREVLVGLVMGWRCRHHRRCRGGLVKDPRLGV